MTLATVIASLISLSIHIVQLEEHEALFIQNLADFIQILIAWSLFTRKRLAWSIYTITLTLEIFIYIVFGQKVFIMGVGGIAGIAGLIINSYALLVLIVFRNSFKRKSVKILSREALIPIGIMLFIFAYIYYKQRDWLYAFDVILGGAVTKFEEVACIIFWACVVVSVYLALRPALVVGIHSKSMKAYARNLIKSYSQNPSAYLMLEDDKILYFGKEVEGVIAYGVVGGVVVALGDPVCADEDFAKLLLEFKVFCMSNDYQCIYLGATDKYIDIYNTFGYGHVKCGEEPRFELEKYQLAGGKMAKMRMNINHAMKAGIETFEYKPSDGRDLRIEKALKAVSDQWLSGKKSSQLKFSIGTVSLDNPMDRRYFYAKDATGKIVAFNVYTPFSGTDGYMADVTRRTNDCPGGATEKIMYDAFMTFKSEGCHWGSMGLAPLANVRGEGIDDALTVKVLDFIYQRFNGFYGFKDLHRAKIKYSPTEWVSGYFVFSGKILTPQMAYAIIKIQGTGGSKEFIKSFIRILRTIKKNDNSDKAA